MPVEKRTLVLVPIGDDDEESEDETLVRRIYIEQGIEYLETHTDICELTCKLCTIEAV